MAEITFCLITKNEEANIERCLTSVRGIAKDIVVVDTGSSDRTIEKAEAMGARVYRHPWKDDFSEARNHALSLAETDWVFQLDADEALLKPDPILIDRLTLEPRAIAYSCFIHNLTRPDSLRDAAVTRFERLFRRSAYEYQGIIHESPVLRSGQAFTPPPADIHIIHWGYLASRLQHTKSARNLKLLEEAVRSNPEDFLYLFQLGNEYARCGRTHDAIDAYLSARRIIAPGNPAYHAVLMVSLIESLLAVRRLNEAVDIAEETAGLYPDYRDALFLAGEAHEAIGARARARHYYEKCASIRAVPASYLRVRQGLDKLAYARAREIEDQGI